MAKVLIYTLLENVGGVEEYVLNLTRYSKDDPGTKYGYIILGTKSVYEEEMKGYGVEYFYVHTKNHILINIRELDCILKENRKDYDIFYSNTSGLYYPIPYMIAWKYKYKIVIHSHLAGKADLKYPFHYINRLWISKIAKKKMACSSLAAEFMFGVKGEPWTIIPNAINLQRFRFNAAERSKIRRQYNLSNEIVIGSIGRLSAIKNQQFMLKIMKRFSERNNDVKLVIVGDGENRKLLEDIAAEYEIKHRVIFAGHTNKPETIMNAFDCFIMTSLAEGFPITLVEVQANGLPAVVSDVITDEVNISNRVSFLKLNAHIDRWCDELLDRARQERTDNIQLLKERGYDIADFEALVWSQLHNF